MSFMSLVTQDVQQLLVRKEEVPPEQQDRSSSLDQEDPEPPHIKEEQEEVWSSQEGEQLQGLEEADISKFPFTPVPVKSEDDEEKPQSSQLHQTHTEQMETGADGEDCGGPEPARNSDPDQHLQPDADEKTSDSSDPETDDSDDWEETREAQSGLNCPQNEEVSVRDERCHKSLTRRSSKQTILPDPMESAEHQLISTKTNSKALVKQRLTAAAEEIFVLFERTIAEYEEELSRSKEENERQRKLLDAVFKPEVRLHRAELCSACRRGGGETGYVQGVMDLQ
ncbi:hypothetical protein L3Q82_003268 [Scortum barcoo]|uniref:Uncharacterized protein n=1 Tax=Scortum barcoo TaxID=214431 RepID=A0ACB8VRM7_9TELE|nr:hypothetical protein L3Q82_003268 [Scortum barcoo]